MKASSSQMYAQTGFSYNASSSGIECDISQKQNVVPSTAQIQCLISGLNQRKHDLKHAEIERKKLMNISQDQKSRIEDLNIGQKYGVEMEENYLRQNQRAMQNIQELEGEKVQRLDKIAQLKKSLQSRYEQFVEMKAMLAEMQESESMLQDRVAETQSRNEDLISHNSELDLLIQNQQSEVYNQKQVVRRAKVEQTTVNSALDSIRNRIIANLTETKASNQEQKALQSQCIEVKTKIQSKRNEYQQNDINIHELAMKNSQTLEVNEKLREDLEKCKAHLEVIIRNNEVMEKNLEEYRYMDGRVSSRLMKKHSQE